MQRKEFINAGLITALSLAACNTNKNILSPVQTKTKSVNELYVPALQPTLEEGNIQKIKYTQTGNQFACSEYIYTAPKKWAQHHMCIIRLMS